MDYLKKLFNSIFWSDIESLEFDEDAITIMNNSRFTLFVTKVSNKSDVFTFIKKLSKNLNCEEICADNKQNVVDSIKREKRLIVTNVDSNELRDLLHVTNELSCLTFVIVEKSRGRFEFSSSLNPVYMAWFWSDSCENKLRALGECCRKSMLCDNVILSELERCIDKNDHGRNLEKYYNDQKNRLHVTARFLGNSGPENLDSAIRQFGSVAKVKMAGFLITPRTFSGYCLLPNNARKLFFDQKLVDLKPHVTLALGGSSKASESGDDQVNAQSIIRDGQYKSLRPFDCGNNLSGTLYDCGQANFYLQLHQPLPYTIMFAPYY